MSKFQFHGTVGGGWGGLRQEWKCQFDILHIGKLNYRDILLDDIPVEIAKILMDITNLRENLENI